MELTRRKLMIIYITILFISFMSGSFLFPQEHILQFTITCDNGTIDYFNYSDEWICEGLPNPLHNNRIETNLSLMIDKFK